MFGFSKNTDHNFSPCDMLFGDLPLTYWASLESGEVPWNLFKQVKKNIDKNDNDSAVDVLNEIINMPGLESRQYLQAYHFLNELQEHDNVDSKVFGVVLEINMPEGNNLSRSFGEVL